mgnify:CR=1 FL=1
MVDHFIDCFQSKISHFLKDINDDNIESVITNISSIYEEIINLNEVIKEWVSIKGYIEPDYKKSNYYDDLHHKYKNLYLSLVSQFKT